MGMPLIFSDKCGAKSAAAYSGSTFLKESSGEMNFMERSYADAIAAPMSQIKKTASDRIHMREVYQKKSSAYKCIKRCMDVSLSGLALIVFSPVFLITAAAIKLEDNGPVFFTQARAGKDMKPFKIYKFRSMRVNADEELNDMMADNEQTGHAFKIKNDPRITRVGKFIRRFSIDELPQLLNIIKGDMSIVGPRPILVFQMEECSQYEKQRLVVQPGLTCYWQIGGRANIKWEEWVELDLDYIEDMSLWTDIKIIVRTFPAVIDKEGGAY
jgi:exopolysaccharide biosynthesis polyprenyl glycosylphosphotransferase